MTPYYDRDGITLYHADCRDILPQLPKVDLVLTDPPYGLDVEYEDSSDDIESWKELMGSAIPLMRNAAPLVVCFCGITTLFYLPKPDWISAHTWRTTGCFGMCGINQWRPILIYGKDIGGFGSVNGVLKSDVFAFSGDDGIGYRRDKGADGHPCPKPLGVMKQLVSRFSNTIAENTILDPFSGSGTTLRAAMDLGRKAIGIEISEKYCEITVERLETARKYGQDAKLAPKMQAVGQKSIFE